MSSVLRTDILNTGLTEERPTVTVQSEVLFTSIVEKAEHVDPTRTPAPAKNIIETTELIRQAILDYEDRLHTTEDGKIDVVYNKPDKQIEIETISIEFLNREPGAWGQGRPWEAKTRNLRPRLRELVDDPDHPGYKRAVMGYFYDTTIRLTCWARTNKAANTRALWLENLMEEYQWYFVSAGVNRIVYQGWGKSEFIDINNNRYYGRCIDYFVKTEKIRNVSQKKLEQLIIKLGTTSVT